MLADLVSGYPLYAPGTFVIKACMFGVHYKTLYLADGPVDEALLMQEHRFVYENTFAADKFHKYVRIPFDAKAAPGPRVPWQQ